MVSQIHLEYHSNARIKNCTEKTRSGGAARRSHHGAAAPDHVDPCGRALRDPPIPGVDRGGSAVRRRLLAWLTTVATVLLFALLAVLLARTGWQEFQFEETSTGLGLPRWWYTGILSVLAVPVALRAIGAHWSKSRGAGTAKGSREAEL